MIGGVDGAIDGLRDKIEDGDRGGSEADRELLLRFSDRLRLLAQDYSDNRHLKLLRHLVRISELVDVDDVLARAVDGEREAAEAAVRWINDEYENPETNRDYRVALRVLGKRVGDCEAVDCDDDGIPRSVAWISTKTPRAYDPAPNAADMLEWEEVDAMADVARHSRDAAMVQLLMDAGPRGGEFFDIRIGDLTESEQGKQLWVDGKTGERSVTLIPSVPYVNRWLTDHPSGEDEDYLWSKLTEPERFVPQRMYAILDDLADRAEVRKDTTPTNFRKSNAYWLARSGANESLINRRQGRKPGSEVIARYVAEFGERTESSAYAKLHGRPVDVDEPEQRDVVDCPRCDRENPPTEDRCMWCGQGLDPVGVERTESLERRIREAISIWAQKDPEAAEGFVDMVATIDDVPEMRAAFRAARAEAEDD